MTRISGLDLYCELLDMKNGLRNVDDFKDVKEVFIDSLSSTPRADVRIYFDS